MITKSPSDNINYIQNLIFTSAARVGFRHLLQNLNLKEEGKILLPAYIGITDREGSGVFDPIQEANTQFDFYAINRNLSIDLDDFSKKASSGEFKLALIIHYFGFLQSDIKEVIKICKSNNLLLIEDCAHTLSGMYDGKLLGDYGDYSFFSIHKVLATETGGALKLNNTNFDIPVISEENERMDRETLEQFLKSDIHGISIKRRENYNYLLGLLSNVDEIEVLYPKLEEGIVPMNFPIIVKNGKREKLYFKLIEKDITLIALYYRLIEEIDRNKFPISYEISDSILNLPIHQDITDQDLDLLAEELKNCLKEI